ncbi:uncharacterized protein LOC127796843 [Diospyros lotus]|uniref:uncharacterized protein LOC127796843 n=1 Tax=Diospyros lotus TaxID=55363 RepID=UPI002254D70C|nr:uncharacterized protein LOC127796843 [Diospyros lotus]
MAAVGGRQLAVGGELTGGGGSESWGFAETVALFRRCRSVFSNRSASSESRCFSSQTQQPLSVDGVEVEETIGLNKMWQNNWEADKMPDLKNAALARLSAVHRSLKVAKSGVKKKKRQAGC